MCYEQLSIDPHICSGKPCSRGTRIMVTNILGLIAGGYTNEQILHTYPELTREDIAPALDDVSHVADEDTVIPRAGDAHRSAGSKCSPPNHPLAPYQTRAGDPLPYRG
jgi:uncharacterized protein (DUF433 family)